MERYVLDTSALFALRDDEAGADIVEKILQDARKGKAACYASFLSFMELFYCVWRHEGRGGAMRAYLEMKMLPVESVDQEESLLILAGEIKALGGLSVIDSWVAATAVEKQARLVHKDPEFEALSSRISLISLPYKSA